MLSNKNPVSNHTRLYLHRSAVNPTRELLKSTLSRARLAQPPNNLSPLVSLPPSSFRMIHEVAKLGFATGTNERYDNARPSYPQEALAALYASIPKNEGTLNIAE